jgi:hypothetical protein
MNPKTNSSQDSRETSSGSFDEPRTIPKKWDVSAFVSRETSARKGAEDQPAEPNNPQNSGIEDDQQSDWRPNPFPQPRTIPGNWDVSGMK